MKKKEIFIVFNGEIYNFKEIKKELLKLGYKFRTNTDTEVIIYSYKEWGIKCLDKFIGMFAFVIFDKKKNEIFCARDRLGIKPLYYFWDGKNFAFASELKALLSFSFVKKEIDLKSLSLYMQFQYIPAPRTIFKNIFKLNQAHFLILKNNRLEKNRYWNIHKFFNFDKLNISENEAIEELEKLLKSSISYRMISDVPIGSFLSGGIDSSVVSSIMQSLSNKPIETFSMGYNEAEFAKEIANHLGTNHNELYVTPNDAKNIIPDLSKYYDEPFADSSAIPTIMVSKLARRKVTVALSGDGGDELFGGYTRYNWMEKFQSVPKIFRPILSLGLKYSPKMHHKKAAALFSWDNPEDQYRSLANIWHKFELEKLINFDIYKDNPTSKYFFKNKSLTENLMFVDMHFYMVEDILTKVDRASMSVSLEARVPLLDHRIVEFALKLPIEYKIKNNKGKYILRKVLEKYVPKEMFERPKSGFAIPLKEWLRDDLYDWMNDKLSSNQLSKHNLFKEDRIKFMIKQHKTKKYDYHYQLWTLLMFQDWYDRYMG